jgi:hypothetical protein
VNSVKFLTAQVNIALFPANVGVGSVAPGVAGAIRITAVVGGGGDGAIRELRVAGANSVSLRTLRAPRLTLLTTGRHTDLTNVLPRCGASRYSTQSIIFNFEVFNTMNRVLRERETN